MQNGISLPHIHLTSQSDWDPTSLDSEIDVDGDQWFECISEIPPDPNADRFDEFGDYRYRVTVKYC